MDVRYLVLLLLLVSCLPEAQVSRGNLAGSSSTNGSGSGNGTTTPIINFNWNYLGKESRSISINVSNDNNAYIIGSTVENYLKDVSLSANYCLVSSFNIGGAVSELRTRVVPVSYYDFTAKRTIKTLRVDFPDVVNSQTLCSGTIDASVPKEYDPNELCENCTSKITATKVKLYERTATGLNIVPDALVPTSLLTLQVDPNNSSSGGSNTCSNLSCQNLGYSCCLENQCVNNGAVKPAAATQYSSLLAVAEEEKKTNPLAYLNYPQLYYICGTNVPGGTTTGGTSGGTGGYDEAFNQLKKDYYCIETLKPQSHTTPFQYGLSTSTLSGTAECLTSNADSEKTMYYKNVIKRLYSTCGCNRTDYDDMITNCPAYDYEVVEMDANRVPTRIDCHTPPVAGPAPTLQTVSVSSRSAPHRFFDDEDGLEKDPAKGKVQEGDKFEYLDDGKVIPNQKPFSMNSILGQMSVTLDQALPAKTLPVELDQVYFISTTSGSYTPCPSCSKDSWLNSFSAFPSSSMGTGLQAVGHTTERDSFGTNTTLGNYEDTIFGRACWLPPTMIPYSHPTTSFLDVKSQRLERLTTQSAFFVNGYQRDWFGFNKGALIGSFDGVSWFAIGKGRIVRSTTKKLFLAINAPFADLASPGMHVVRVQAYDGVTQAAQVDYDPQYHQSHPFQNEAGSCQKYHMCSTDTDCVTKLGWEYACADVKDLKTNWPQFDIKGDEIVNSSANLTLDKILTQKRFPSSSTKRCVYRGAGSLCHSNVSILSTGDLNKRKLLACAPNFFCANAGSAAHNDKIARFASSLEDIPLARNHLYGKDANILGRPLNYVGTTSLLNSIRQTLINNTTSFEPTMATFVGLCQPGKALPEVSNQTLLQNPLNQNASADPARRTDFISQIGSCNVTLFNDFRHTSCPVIGSDGNYEVFSSASLPVNFAVKARGQNACGLESLHTSASLSSAADALTSSSPFREIEAKTLNSQIILDRTLARDACFRRAGAVCHTDLDCSPNKLHASKVDLFGTAFFGNIAEKNYWNESLVCGQTDPKPFASNTEAFKNYDMSLNRCCREVGKDLTTFTADIPTGTTTAKAYDPDSAGLKMSTPATNIPNDPKRYSRLLTVENIGGTNRPILTANINKDGAGNLTAASNISTPEQWKTLSEANSETCCGGGWIRKFSDGSNDWTRRDRVNLDVTNFRCINSRTALITHPEDLSSQYNNADDVRTLVTQDYGDYCKDGTNTKGSCAQYSIIDSLLDIVPEDLPSSAPYGSITVNTLKPNYSMDTNPDYYFTPRSGDGDSAVIVDYANNSATSRRNIVLKIPSYVTRTFDAAIASNTPNLIRMVSETGARSCDYTPGFAPSSPTSLADAPGCASGCCYSYDNINRILKVGLMTTTAAHSDFANKKVGVTFTTTTPGYSIPFITRTKPGTSAYYLKRLGRLELSGIPQMSYEVLTCNDNTDRLLPGIFNSTMDTVTKFTNSSYNMTYMARKYFGGTTPITTPVTGRFTNVHGLLNEPVFSANDFKCCSPLGKTVTDASKCCSGFATSSGSVRTCALPSGTDLMVYFNRFVSNEGVGTDKPGGGLQETDFDSLTGEPVLSAAVNDKIRSLGAAYCASKKVRQGGAFGSFEVEPQGTDTNLTSRIYNIVDSTRDVGQNSNAGSTDVTGYPAFSDGFRWNHHLYCND